MNNYYAKTALYVYPCIEKLISQIDGLVEKKAYASMEIFVPCEEICDYIIGLTEQKKKWLKLYLVVKDVLKSFTQEEIEYIDYKYFRKRSFEIKGVADFYASRNYYRKQKRIIAECAKLLDEKGYNEEWFIKEYMELPFFKEMFKRIKKKDEEIQNRILSTGKPVSMKLTRKKEMVWLYVVVFIVIGGGGCGFSFAENDE